MDAIETTLHDLADCYDYYSRMSIKGLRQNHAYADLELPGIRMQLEGRAELVARVLEFVHAGCPDFNE